MIITKPHRLHTLDYLRGFAFLLMAIDHSLHGYAQKLGRFWFFQDDQRLDFFDAAYMHNNSVIIPLLFFAIGTAVIPGLKSYGLKDYIKNRVIRYGVPFVVCIPTCVAVLTYPKYVERFDPNISFLSYWFGPFFTERLQAGPLWVCYALLLYTVIAVVCYQLFPRIFNTFKNYIQWSVAKPIQGFLAFSAISVLILGIADLIWGAPWWAGFWKLFYMQGSRFLQQALFFFTGVALGALGHLDTNDLWDSIGRKWLLWLALVVVFGGLYIWYSLTYFFDGAYDLGLIRHFHYGGSLGDAWPVIKDVAPGRLIRTSLHGVFCLSQILLFTALIARYTKPKQWFWTSLALNGYGIFLIHEMLVVMLQFWLNTMQIPSLFKFCIVAGIAIPTAWALSNFLRQLPGFKSVFGTYRD